MFFEWRICEPFCYCSWFFFFKTFLDLFILAFLLVTFVDVMPFVVIIIIINLILLGLFD